MPIEVLDSDMDRQHRADMLDAALGIKALQIHDRSTEIHEWLETALSDTADGTMATIDYRIAAANVSVFDFDAETHPSQADRRLAHVMGRVLHHVAEITPRHAA